MQSRREFLRSSGALAVGIAIPGMSVGAPPSTVKGLDTVKLVTSKLVVAPGRWRWIIGHHSAIKYGNLAVYDREHRRRGKMDGLGYHFVIGNGIDSGDGEIEIGPRWLEQIRGGHVATDEFNISGIGICVIGNFEI